MQSLINVKAVPMPVGRGYTQGFCNQPPQVAAPAKPQPAGAPGLCDLPTNSGHILREPRSG